MSGPAELCARQHPEESAYPYWHFLVFLEGDMKPLVKAGAGHQRVRAAAVDARCLVLPHLPAFGSEHV